MKGVFLKTPTAEGWDQVPWLVSTTGSLSHFSAYSLQLTTASSEHRRHFAGKQTGTVLCRDAPKPSEDEWAPPPV